MKLGWASGALIKYESFGVHLDLCETTTTPRPAEQIQVPLAGSEEMEEAHAPVPAGMGKTEQGKVILKAHPLHPPGGDLPVVPELSNRVLRVVVIPRDTVVIQEREQLLPIPQQ